MQSKGHTKIQFKEQVGEQGITALKRVITEDLNLLAADSVDAINIGYTIPINVPQAIKKIMDWWAEEMDEMIDTYIFNKGESLSDEYIAMMAQRGCTFSEFQLFLTGNVQQENYHHYRVFEFLMMNDEIQRQQFINRLPKGEDIAFENYIGLLLTYQIPPMDFFLRTVIPLYYPKAALSKHCYLVSQSGAGKSELLKLLIYDLIRKSSKKNQHSIVVMEPASDLSQEILSFVLFRKKQRDRLIYINPSIHKLLKSQKRYTPVLNFFDIPAKDEETIDAFSQEITNGISEMIKKPSSSDDAFTTNMDAFLKPCISTLLRKGDTDLSELKRFMNDDNNEDLVELGKLSPDPEHRAFFHTGFLNKRYKPTKDAIYIKLQSLLNSPLFRRLVTGKSTINLEQALNQGKVVIIDFAKSRGKKTASDFGRLMLAYIQAIATRRQDTPKQFRKQIFCFVDEFQNYIGNSISEIMAEARKYKLSLILSHQIVGQKMNAELTDMIISNSTLKIVGKNAKKSLETMGANIDIPIEQLKKIPKYEFYVHNKDSEKPAVLMKSPDFLVTSANKKNRFYMSPQDKTDLLWYFVNESEYYREIIEEEVPPIEATTGILERGSAMESRKKPFTPKGKTLEPGLDL